MKKNVVIALALASTLLLGGCASTQNMNSTTKGVLAGAAAGALTGALVTSHSGIGAVAGAPAGAIVGGFIGWMMDEDSSAHIATAQSDVTFAFDSARLNSDDDEVLNKVIAKMTQYPNIKVKVAGFTDSTGNPSYNQRLSKRRAQSAADYLVKHGIARSRLKASGYGEQYPVASNNTDEGRAANRRVEFVVAAG